jgi:hypothetical protein
MLNYRVSKISQVVSNSGEPSYSLLLVSDDAGIMIIEGLDKIQADQFQVGQSHELHLTQDQSH